MRSLEQFFLRHRARLQRFLDDDVQIIQDPTAVHQFVNTVHVDWDRLRHFELPPLSRTEMTFWFCLYELESIADIPIDQPLLEFEQSMFTILREVRDLLRQNKPLSSGFYASRPRFNESTWDIDADMLPTESRDLSVH